MSAIRFWLLGREFSLTCDPGQEARLEWLVGRLKERVEALNEAAPAANRNTQAQMQILVLAAVTFADEFQDAREALGRMQEVLQPPPNAEEKALGESHIRLLARLEALENRMLSLGERLAIEPGLA